MNTGGCVSCTCNSFENSRRRLSLTGLLPKKFSTEPANAVDLIYEQMYEIAIGIEMAGPDLTPANFETGMRAYPGSQAGAANALYGTWGFPTGHFTPQEDAAIIYWDPNKISPYNQKQGAYVTASPRYKQGQFPSAPPPLPSNFPITPNSTAS